MDLKDFIKRKKILLIIIGIIILIFAILYYLLYSYYVGRLLILHQPPLRSEVGEEILFVGPPLNPSNPADQEIILAEFEKCLDENQKPVLDVNIDWKDEMYIIAKALMEKDENVCSTLEEESKDRCQRNFYKFMALINEDDSYCEKFTTDDPDGQICFAIVNKDVVGCDRVAPPLRQEICRAGILGPEQCDKLSGSYDSQGVCIQIEGQEGIKETCGQISEEEAKSLCQNSAYVVKAIREKNYGICDKIDIRSGHFTILFCRVLTGLNPQKEWRNFYIEYGCYEKYATMVAKIKNDPSLCEEIPLKDSHNEEEYQNCIKQFE